MYEQVVEHTREVYSVMDILGDLGGLIELVFGAIGIFILPISHYQFNVKAIQTMFLAKTKDKSLFPKQDQQKRTNSTISATSNISVQQDEIKSKMAVEIYDIASFHRPI